MFDCADSHWQRRHATVVEDVHVLRRHRVSLRENDGAVVYVAIEHVVQVKVLVILRKRHSVESSSFLTQTIKTLQQRLAHFVPTD